MKMNTTETAKQMAVARGFSHWGLLDLVLANSATSGSEEGLTLMRL